MFHNFEESLRKSHEAEDLPFWEECYRKAFPTFAAMVNHRKSGWHQHRGIDRSVIFESSNRYKVDEKVRWRNKNGIVYEDIALEHLSDEKRKTPGWVCKELEADYIAYAIAPLGRCYLLPVPQLQAAWLKHGDSWIGRYLPSIRAFNDGYVTVSVGVPVPVLYQAIGEMLRVTFEPFEGVRPRSEI